MPIPVFSRSSPKQTKNSSNTHQQAGNNSNNSTGRQHHIQSNHQTTDMAGKETNRPPLFPLQDATWNSSLAVESMKNDLLTTPTPRSVVKWLSSTPLPDPFFDSCQENLNGVSTSSYSTVSPDQKPNLQPPSSASSSLLLPSSFKTKIGMKESCSSIRSSASSSNDTVLSRSNSLGHDTTTMITRSHSLDQKSFHSTISMTTPIATVNSESDSGTVNDMPVARSLKYGVSSNGNGSLLQPPSLSTSQPHFEIEEDPNFWKEHNVQV